MARKKIDFVARNYEYGTLDRFEANNFVDAVITSAFPITETENGTQQMDYDPLSKLMGLKINIIKFYGDVDFDKLSIDELYQLAVDIDIEDFKQSGINQIQFEDMLKAIDEKCDFIKQQMIMSSVNSDLDDLLEITSALSPMLEMADKVFKDTDPETMNKILKAFVDGKFELDATDVVDAVVNSENFKKNRADVIDAIKQGAADAVSNNVVPIDERK